MSPLSKLFTTAEWLNRVHLAMKVSDEYLVCRSSNVCGFLLQQDAEAEVGRRRWSRRRRRWGQQDGIDDVNVESVRRREQRQWQPEDEQKTKNDHFHNCLLASNSARTDLDYLAIKVNQFFRSYQFLFSSFRYEDNKSLPHTPLARSFFKLSQLCRESIFSYWILRVLRSSVRSSINLNT